MDRLKECEPFSEISSSDDDTYFVSELTEPDSTTAVGPTTDKPPIAPHPQPKLSTNRFALLSSSTVRKGNLLKSPIARDICKLTERMVVSIQGNSSQISQQMEGEDDCSEQQTATAKKKQKKAQKLATAGTSSNASSPALEAAHHDDGEEEGVQHDLIDVSSEDEDGDGEAPPASSSAAPKMTDERLKRIELQFAGGKKAAAKYAAKNCSQKNSDLLISNSHQELQHKFTHLLVIDFEATCDSAEPDYPHEIIEFPCVAVDLRTLKVVSEFGTFVKPVKNPILTEFCTALTGIQQADVDSAPSIREAIEMFNAWLSKLKTDWEASVVAAKQHQGKKTGAEDEVIAAAAPKPMPFNPVFATDGPWDMRKFMHECHVIRDGVTFPELFYKWIDVRRCFSDFFHKQLFKLTKMLRALGMSFVGERHRGIDDSRNIARVAIALARRGYKYRQTASIAYFAEGSKLLAHERNAVALLKELEDEEADLKAAKNAKKRQQKENLKKGGNNGGGAGKKKK